MKTFDDESLIFDTFRSTPSRKVIFNGRFFHCLHIKFLTKCFLFSRSWIDSSDKSLPPPDFHNDRHHIMMEVMRFDDCVNEIDGKHVVNSFERANSFMKKHAGKDYKKKVDGTLVFNPDTRDSNAYNFNGYFANFEKVIMKHSEKVAKYRENYPKCETTVFLVCDESNNYVQVTNEADLKREDEHDVHIEGFFPHHHFHDDRFINIIRNCNADYVIWYGRYKLLFINGKAHKYPVACIFDVKHLKSTGRTYNHDLMFKVKEEQANK